MVDTFLLSPTCVVTAKSTVETRVRKLVLKTTNLTDVHILLSRSRLMLQ